MSDLRLSRAVDLFLGEQIKTTRKSYRSVMRDLVRIVGDKKLVDIRPEHILEYMQDVRARPQIKSTATINKYIKTIKTFFNWCVKAEFLADVPTKMLKTKKRGTLVTRDKAMPERHYQSLLEYSKWDSRYYALVLFLGDTGCRIGGAAGLQWENINLPHRQATVTEKGKPPRPVFFGDECKRALMEWQLRWKGGQGRYVFQKRGRRMGNDSLGQLFRRLCKRAKIGSYGPHSLRHRKGHQLADAKVNPTTASMALGHSDPTITLQHYYPKDWDRVQREVEKLSTASEKLKNVINWRAE